LAPAIRVVHYVNQFFGGIGGDEKADVGPSVIEGALGPGRLMLQMLKGRGEVVATVICGDNYISEMPGFTEEHKDKALDVVRQALDRYAADVLLAGPAFDSCRYGLGCAEVCLTAQAHGIPALTGMHPENPAVEIHCGDVYILPTGDSPSGMAVAMSEMVEFALKLCSGQHIGSPGEEGYIPKG
jgi:glycine reductase